MTHDDGHWADDLIEAIGILRRYHDGPNPPFACEHDALHVAVDVVSVSAEDRERLECLGFGAGLPEGIEPQPGDGFISWRYGSC